MNANPPGQVRELPAGAGLAWLAKSLALVRAQPGRLLLLTVLMQALLGLSQIPVLGILVVLAVPALSAGLLQAFYLVENRQHLPLAVLFAPLVASPRTGRLLALGALMFAIGVLSVTLLLGGETGGLDPELLARIEQGDTEALVALDPAFVLRAVTALGVAVSVTGVLSYLTIPLIWFSGLSVGRALLTGLRAMLVNWKPFLMLGLGLAALMVPVMLVLGMLFGMAGASPGGSVLALVLVMLFLLVFQLAVFGTQYCAHQAIFGRPATDGTPQHGPDDDDATGGNGDDGQLVA